MKTSILLATYNGENYLPQQLASLSAQEGADFTVLYQDDGSSDGTPARLEAWSKSDSRFFPAAEQGKHLGAAGNFFSLLKQTDADFVLLCDQDDIWLPHKVTTLLRAAQQVTDPSRPLLVHSDAIVMDAQGKELAPSFFHLQGWNPAATHLNQLLVQNNATGCMMLLNRPLVDLVISYGDPAKMFMHDWFIALTAAAFGEIIFVDEPLTMYRQHGDNAIGASKASLLQRGLQALSQRQKSKVRIALTYSHTKAFQDAYGDALPETTRQVVESYLSTQSMSKIPRLLSIHRQGCLMQSPVTRLGQYFFG